MKAWTLDGIFDLTAERHPLQLSEVQDPVPGPGEVLIRVTCCGICHTELDEIEGRTPPPKYPIIPGHQVVGRVLKTGNGCTQLKTGDRVGVAWISSACGHCDYCAAGYENLCKDFIATGRDHDGGYAELITVHEGFAYPIPPSISNEHAAPLLCAGAIGYRSLRMTNLKNGQALLLSGFGASGHLMLKTAKFLYPQSAVFVFARSKEEQQFALQLGCDWAGDFSSKPPALAHAAIDTTPAWKPIISSLSALRPGGRLVINTIRKESKDQHDLVSLDYTRDLWMEKEVKSVANITRSDVKQFLSIATDIPVKPEVELYAFENANEALLDLKHKHVKGAKVLLVSAD